MRKEAVKAYDQMPFRTQLSLEPLFKKISSLLSESDNRFSDEAGDILKRLGHCELLRGKSVTPEELQTHQDEVKLLMHFVFPELEDGEALCQAYRPFSMESFFSTSKFKDIFENPEVETDISESTEAILEDYYRENLLFAYQMLFHIHYQVEHVRSEFTMKATAEKTGLARYFMANYSFNFTDIDFNGLEIIPRERFARLLIMRDLEELERAMPLAGVTFYGFTYKRYVEVTEKENISMLKSDLVEPSALNRGEMFERIVSRIRSILQVDDLDAGLVFRYRGMRDKRHCTMRSVLRDYAGAGDGLMHTIYGEVINGKQPLFVPDLSECGCPSDIVDHLRKSGVVGLALIPLIDNGQVLGVLELTSGQREMISRQSAIRLAELFPVLTIAVKREMAELESQVERVIKQHCTAIHPSVEWRFEDAAFQYLTAEAEHGEKPRFEDIVFQDVHPLYGSMDIRSSSAKRNQAIQADLLEHLNLATSTLVQVFKAQPIPIADYYLNVLERFRKSVEGGLNSGDEISVIEFLQSRVEPFLEYVRENTDLPEETVASYFEKMNPAVGIIYQQRRDYEQSVSLLNHTLSAFLDKAEVAAQEIFPHYFEKYRTDGLEYNIYVGQAMAADRVFDEIQLKNLRIWQLTNMCEMTRLADSLVRKMKTPLTCAPLILAHSAPLTIKFTVDEKHFEVEGSYNVRYEIIKKRIDKSTVAGSGERLTQPGMLSLIYTQDKEGDEYRRYFEYLADKGFLTGEVEHLVLEDLEGVHGLRALRARVA